MSASKHLNEVAFNVRWHDGQERVTVDFWPDEVRIDARFLEQADPERVARDADEVTFRVDNGEATYRILACDNSDTYHAALVRGSWRPLV